MRYCPRCKIEVFGGSRCDRCGGPLLDKQTQQAPKAVHVTEDMILGAPKRLKSELAQSVTGRVFRLVVEIVIFCAAFYGVSWLLHIVANFLSIEMSMDRLTAKKPIDWNSTGVRYYLYVGWAVVTALTIKFRWRAGK